MALPRRALFRRGNSYRAVKVIPIVAGTTIPAGEAIPAGFPEWRLRAWYRRGLIGVVGDPWTEWKLEQYAGKVAAYEARTALADSPPGTGDTVASEANASPEATPTADAPIPASEVAAPVITEKGGGWFEVAFQGDLHTVRGQDAADEKAADLVAHAAQDPASS